MGLSSSFSIRGGAGSVYVVVPLPSQRNRLCLPAPTSQDTQNFAEDIWQNMNASVTYPRIGDAKGRFRKAWQLAIRCRETVAKAQCGVPGRRVLAYVIQGSGEDGPQVSFCPDFFDPTIPNAPKDLSTLSRQTPTKNLAQLMTYGQIVLHEFMVSPPNFALVCGYSASITKC